MKIALLTYVVANLTGAAVVAVTRYRRLAAQMDGGPALGWPNWLPYVAVTDLVVVVVLWVNQ